MHIEEHHWYSGNLERQMHLKVYGHWGSPVLVFPCSQGRYYDYETMGMIASIAGFIDSGRIKIFAVDSIDAESWYNWSLSPAQRNSRHEAYDRYIVEEVVPFIRSQLGQPQRRILANGCSMGALHAVNFFFKHPDLFAGTLALSGLYRLDRSEFGLGAHDLDQVYFNSPLSYLGGLDDPWYLERYRHSSITVCVGQGAWEEEALADTRDLDAQLAAKAIPAWIDYWGHDVNHDWPWWYRQMDHFLSHLVGRW